MQTFIPYPRFKTSAAVLDRKRLGNQFYREGLTLIRGGWPNHPASKMWSGYKYYLGLYLCACYFELKTRGKDYRKHYLEVRQHMEGQKIIAPPWLGDERVHSSHRANLLRKDPKHYSQFGWTETPAEGYYWPV